MARRALAWITTVAGLLLIVILVTGGFRFQVGPATVSVHRVGTPLLLLIVGALALAIRSGPGLAGARDALAAIADDLSRYALSIAVVCAAAVAGVGLGFGTYAASAADPSGYVSAAALLDSGHLSRDEPLARAVGWHDAAWTFSPLGYRPGRAPGTIVPGYPLGLPLVMAAARRLAGEVGPFLVGPALAALMVLATYAIAARFASRTAGAVAAVLVASSPIVHFQVVLPMSDVPATAWWALAIACALAGSRVAAAGAGLLAGLAVLTRPNLAPLAAVVAMVSLGWPRADRGSRFDLGRAAVFLVALTPAVLSLAAVQRVLYGSAFTSGYGDIGDFFSVANIWPNVRDYSRRLVEGESGALLLASAAVAVLSIVRPRVPVGRLVPLVKLAAAAAAVVLAIYLPYGVFPDWPYLRFLMPAMPLAFALVGGLVAAALDRLPPAARGVTLLASLTLVVSFNAVHAWAQAAYDLRDYEARYRTVGLYLAASLPANAVIVTSQESGSAAFYTGLPVLRWDLLATDLDEALAKLRTLGRRPVLVVEDWEKPALRARFPRSPSAGLDWPARADAGRTTRVGVWEPEDRGNHGGTFPTDHLP